MFIRFFNISIWLAVGFILLNEAQASSIPNIYLFPFPPGFKFAHAAFFGAEFWNGPRPGESIQITRLSDRHNPIANADEAKGLLQDLIKIRQNALIGIVAEPIHFDEAKFRFQRAHSGWEFSVKGEIKNTFGSRMRVLERWYVQGTETYEFIYTEPAGALKRVGTIEAALANFWPTDVKK